MRTQPSHNHDDHHYQDYDNDHHRYKDYNNGDHHNHYQENGDCHHYQDLYIIGRFCLSRKMSTLPNCLKSSSLAEAISLP